MRKFPDIVGKRFGKLVVVGLSELKTGKNKNTNVVVKCDCGNTKTIPGTYITRGNTISCGCFRREGNNRRHGKSESPTYNSWSSMIQRCTNKHVHNYAIYGAKNIKVCKKWFSFSSFLADMGERPDGHSLDRIDSSGDYCPENCRWATIEEQNNNKKNVCMVEYDGKKQTLSRWAKELDVKHNTLYSLWKRNNNDFTAVVPMIKHNRSKYGRY